MKIKKLDRNTIETGGFYGIVQKRLIVNPQYGPKMGVTEGTWPGIGNLIYLADSWFETGVATGMHPHKFIDVLTFVVEGKLDHEGSLEHGKSLNSLDFQVQKSGKEGFIHNEVNYGKQTTRMLQLWLMPEREEENSGFRIHKAEKGKITKIYGIEDSNTTQIEVGYLTDNQKYKTPESCLIYMVSGEVRVEGELIEEGILFEADGLTLESVETSLFVIAYAIK